MSQEDEKRRAGHRAAAFIQNGQTVGVGTGSTVFYFIEKLAERIRGGLDIQAVSSSKDSSNTMTSLGIPTTDIEKIASIDITVDGADEIDPQKNMIKGAGGAFFREKMLAFHSRKMVVIVDSSKSVQQLGAVKLPVEIAPFFYKATLKSIEAMGFSGTLRTKDRALFITDNNNYIYDIHPSESFRDSRGVHSTLISLPGVIETGLFFDVADTVIIGTKHKCQIRR